MKDSKIMDEIVRQKFDAVEAEMDHKIEKILERVDAVAIANSALLGPLGVMTAKTEFNSTAIWWIIVFTITNLLAALSCCLVLLWKMYNGSP